MATLHGMGKATITFAGHDMIAYMTDSVIADCRNAAEETSTPWPGDVSFSADFELDREQYAFLYRWAYEAETGLPSILTEN